MPAKPKDTKPKSRVTVRLKEAVGASKARNRSADLVKLTDQYHAFLKKVKGLLVVLRNHHGSMMALQKTRLAVAHAVAKMAERSPISDCISDLPSPDRPPEQVCSYISVHSQIADKSKSYISKYAQFVIEYVIEWEKVVTGRIEVGVKKAEELRRDLDHYQQKVESLRQSANVSMAKGKMVDGKSADRLSRNEEKFIKSKQEYDLFATDLCILIEEVTERSWRDLHPLLIKLAQFDLTMSDDESKMMKNLNNVVKDLKDVAARTKLSPQPRLKEIEHQKAEVLNTRQGGDLRIEAGGDDGSVFGTGAATPMAQPPGSVAPQGLGGFPVQVSDDGADTRARTASYASFDSGAGPGPTAPPLNASFGVGSTQRSMRSPPNSSGVPSTADIVQMTTASAPPPTMDQLNDAYAMGGRNTSGGGLPPLGPSSGGYPGAGGGDAGSAYGGSAYGGSQFGASNDALTVYSGASAPAPAAPPPPPPMGAPPPPPPHQAPNPVSMYPAPAAAAPPPPQPYGYPQQGYPPQPGYPPQQHPGYPPQQHPGYPPQQQPGYPPQQSPYGIPPQQPAPYGMGAPPAVPPSAPFGMPQQQPASSWGAPQGGRPPSQGVPLNSTNPFDN